ncbi:MAG: DUF503 domain-containing protein [Acidobacteriota bacterium]
MIVGVVTLELHLPEARSLKQKRKVVKGLVDRLHARLKVSVAETDHHDLHQRAEIGLAVVARSDGEAERHFDAMRSVLDQQFDAVVTRFEPELVEIH